MAEFDKTKRSIGVNNLDDKARKEMFNKFQSVGGKVVSEKDKKKRKPIDNLTFVKAREVRPVEKAPVPVLVWAREKAQEGRRHRKDRIRGTEKLSKTKWETSSIVFPFGLNVGWEGLPDFPQPIYCPHFYPTLISLEKNPFSN